MNIWFDLCHPPHVPFFVPQIRELKQQGHQIEVTIRDRFQVRDLCDGEGIEYHVIGDDSSKNKLVKALGVIRRTYNLYRFARQYHFDIAVSQGSSYQVLAATLARIPSIFMTDYEHIFFSIARVFATKIFVPEIIPDTVIKEKQIRLDKVVKYPGLKEYVYLEKFKPDSNILKDLKLNFKDIIITLRPPAVSAHYHNPVSEKYLAETILYLSQKNKVTVIYLPRTEDEKLEAKHAFEGSKARLIIPEKTVDGLNLIWYSDLIISGGGTMNREAAALGVPVYSIFKGRIGAVDQFLVREKKLQFVEHISDIKTIKIQKRPKTKSIDYHSYRLTSFLVESILSSIPS